MELQIAFSVCIQQKIPELIPLLPSGSSSKEFYEDLTRARHLLKCKREKISDNLLAPNLMSPAVLDPTLISYIESKIGRTASVFTFKRIQVNRDVSHSKAYLNIVRRNSYTVLVNDAGLIEVKFYLKVYVQCPNVMFCTDACTCKVSHYYGVTDCRLKPATDITISSEQFTDCNVGHIISARREECKNVIFPVTSVKALCVLVDRGYEQCVFVCKLPNRCEKD